MLLHIYAYTVPLYIYIFKLRHDIPEQLNRTTKIDHLPYYYLERKHFNKLAWSDDGESCLDYLYFFKIYFTLCFTN